ncbi:MAG TPA: Crp/Fnr family transcriptional regulator [Usitatibacter sp.]|nr:Crp/Fnr family transcriptional regulator [Usitatibacter sp.]
MARAAAPLTNQLLDRLPAKDRGRFINACDRVELEFEQVLDQPGNVIGHVYFPLGGWISLLAPIGKTGTLEVALAGNEGMYGLPAAFGIERSPVRALVQGAGPAYRIKPAAFRSQLARAPTLATSIGRYSHVVMSQVMQTAGCNRFHKVEQRLARWLLMTADRAYSLTLRITHEFLAHMLGVRRVGITQAAGALQRKGLISYSRGVLNILDRKGLERAACACYRADVATYAKAFSRPA